MNQKNRWISGALVLVGALFGAEVAEAQSQPATSAAANAVGAKALGNPKEDDIEDEGKKNPMAWAGIGVKAGLSSVRSGGVSIQGYDVSSQARTGMQLSVPINMGGSGFGFVIEPMLTSYSISHEVKNTTGVVTGSESVSLLGLGGYLGPTINFHVIDPLYLGFGFGLRGTYMLNSAYEYAADIGGRVPLTATYYVSKQVALVGEVGLGYGASLFADKPEPMLDPLTQSITNVQDDPSFGLAFAWDASIGARFP